MRTIIILIATILTANTGCAQSPVLPLNAPAEQITNGAYKKDTQNQLPPFEGTWVYQSGNKKVTLKFKKIMYHINWGYPAYYKDVLEANYKVEEGGTVMHDDLNDPFDGHADISGHFFKNGKYRLSFRDFEKCDIGGDAEIWIDSTGKLHWEMKLSYAQINEFVDCPQVNDPGFFDSMTLPYEMVLTKQTLSGG